MSSPIRAVAAAHFGPNTGLVPLLLITTFWAALAVFKPDAYVAESAWYIACVGAMMGLGLRLHFASHRSSLMPGLREANRIVAFGVVFLAFLAIVVADRARMVSPTSLALLWLGALFCLYVAGLSKSLLAVIGIAMLLGAMLPGIWVRDFFAQRLLSLDAKWVVLTDVLLTIFIWRRIGTIRGRSWTVPGTEQTAIFEIKDRGSVAKSLDSMTSRVSSGLWGRASHFAFITRSGTWNFYMQALRWSAIAFFFHQILSSRVFAVLAFAAPLIVPVVTMRLSISPRLFMLPLKRAEIVKCWGIAVFVSLVKSWAALAVPYGVLVLTAGTATSTDPIPLPLLMATTLAAQLPIFGATMAISSLRIRYSVFLLPFFFLFGIAGIVAAFRPTIIVGILLGSIILGPPLIWFAYRRWCNTEIRFSSIAQALSQP